MANRSPDSPQPPSSRQSPRPPRPRPGHEAQPRPRPQAKRAPQRPTRSGRAGAARSEPPRAPTEPEAEADTLGGGLLWHGAGLVRATAIDLAILAGHLLLYPTGMLPEHEQPPEHLQEDRPADPKLPKHPYPLGAGHSVPATQISDAATGKDTPDPHPPVLLLHGFVDNRSAFTLLRRSLLRNGWTRVQAVNYSPLTPDIRTAAEQLGAHVERACAQSGRDQVDIVAHSLGGLIARYYVQRLDGDARVRTLVTLGTPHSGTRAVPALVPHPLARQMRPGSAVLTDLAGAAKGCRTRFVAFWSDLDQLMIPVEAARLEHSDLSVKNIKVHGVGHLALPVHGSVAAEIRQELTAQPPPSAAVDAA